MNTLSNLPLTAKSGIIIGLIGIPGTIPFLNPEITISLVDSEGNLVQETTSNKQGLYFLRQVPAGSYTLQFEHENYLLVSKEVTVPPLSIQSVNIELQPETSILVGAVSEETTEQPIIGVTIVIRKGYLPIKKLITDEQGRFEAKLSVGNYNVDYYKPGYYQKSTEASILKEQTTNLEVNLQRTTGMAIGIVTHLPENSSIAKPLEQVTVQLIKEEELLASTNTNSIGLYLLNDLPLNLSSLTSDVTEYTLVFSKTGYETVTYPLKLTHLFSTTISVQNIHLEPEL